MDKSKVILWVLVAFLLVMFLWGVVEAIKATPPTSKEHALECAEFCKSQGLVYKALLANNRCECQR